MMLKTFTNKTDIFPIIQEDPELAARFGPTKMFWWCWETHYGMIPYRQNINDLLNDECKQSCHEEITANVGRRTYIFTIDGDEGFQSNTKSRYKRKLQLLSTPDTRIFPEDGRWYYDDPESKNSYYFPTTVSKKIEEAFLEQQPRCIIRINEIDHSFNFCCGRYGDDRALRSIFAVKSKLVRKIHRRRAEEVGSNR
eukprot:TRINITY_DN493_c0_g1_i7.p1 TRINITY_DN493_c0_g1~~TRINITY_DN493_c0_g1_i7.p1  ORF type:complete len:196 (-),score=27.44 TRINITY_DN493_c0_g1_i7:197-784(-)